MASFVFNRSVDSRKRYGKMRGVGAAAAAVLAVGVIALAGHGSAPSAAGQGAATTVSIYETTLMERDQKTVEVSTEELRGILAANSAFVFDARPTMEYAVSHIPGALNVAQKPGTPTSLYISDVAEIGRLAPEKNAALVLYCNGPFCGKSKRLSEELLEAGYTNVRRYQLGAPVWRALVGTMEIELEGIRYVLAGDRTAVVFDVRSAEEFAAGSLAGARHLPLADVTRAKDDGRLPMEDHNTRIIVLGRDGEQARAVAEEIARNAFHNVTYFNGGIDSVLTAVQ
jgi:rhodanese-related sulfurtransferase